MERGQILTFGRSWFQPSRMTLRSLRLNQKKKKGTIDAVEIETELKSEPEDETELQQPHDKT